MILALFLLSMELDQWGKPHQLGTWPQQTFVIDFAASWCAPCHKVLPQLEAIKTRHPEWAILVVSVDKTEAGRNRLVKQHNLKLPVIWDKEHAWASFFDPPAMPTTLVVDRHGKILASHSGYREDLEAFLGNWLDNR